MKRTKPEHILDRVVAWSFERPLPTAVQYIFAASAVMLVGAIRILLIPTQSWLLFIPAVIAVALVAGKGPGIFAAMLSAVVGLASTGIISDVAWLPQSQWITTSLFLLVMVGLVTLTAELRETMRRSRALNEAVRERERLAVEHETFMSSVLAASTDCIKVLELDGTLSFMSEGGLKVMEIRDFEDVRGRPWTDLLEGEGRELVSEALGAAREGRSSHFEAGADTRAGTPKWWSVSVSPIIGADGAVKRILSVSRDHTILREARERQRLLNDELNHRMKNTLAIVQSLANQTLRNASGLEEASTALSSRLSSLGHATDILTATSWATARLGDVVDAGLSAVSAAKERISIEGDQMNLNPQAALALTLALHELATNATKYGALSNETGTVRISWQVTDREGASRLSFLWRERGGPPVTPPARLGFGSRMIERSLRSYFDGETVLSYLPAGVEFRIDASLGGVGAPVEGRSRGAGGPDPVET